MVQETRVQSQIVIPKTQKMVLDASLLNIQYYKVSIKGKMQQFREWSSALSYTSFVVAIETTVANFTFSCHNRWEEIIGIKCFKGGNSCEHKFLAGLKKIIRKQLYGIIKW